VGGPLAAAALITLAVRAARGGAYRTIGTLTADRDGLPTRVHALEDTVSTFIHGPATQLIQIPVSTGGRVGSVTIFADSVRHRWLVRCDGLAPNARDQAYQLWFITERGMATAAVMPIGPGQADGNGLEDARRRSAGGGCGDDHRAAGWIGEPERPGGVPPAALAPLFREIVDRFELQDFLSRRFPTGSAIVTASPTLVPSSDLPRATPSTPKLGRVVRRPR